MQFLILLFLILLNGLFAMAEIAIASSRKTKLQQMSNEGNTAAQTALDLANQPNRFLSTVQIGITLIGVFAGAFGGIALAEPLADQLKTIPFMSSYSEGLALGLVVLLITYLSLILGELVPKRLALNNPEKVAILVAQPMYYISLIGGPLVNLLSVSTEFVLKLLKIKPYTQTPVSEEEVTMLIREGEKVGVFETAEKDIVERTLRLGDKKVSSLMTPRKEIVWLGIDSPYTTLKNKITKRSHSHFPVCRDSLDKVIGIVRTDDLLKNYFEKGKIELEQSLHKPLLVPENTDGLRLLELFKKTGIHMALVIDEFGTVQGLVSLTNILEEIVGDIPSVYELKDEEIMKREDGSYLVDGLISIHEFKDYFHIKKLIGERSGTYHTMGGYVMNKLNKIPQPGDNFELENLRFEVVDMDGNRVDKILITPLKKVSKPYSQVN